jgi:photosystem II stability/assembly factor-like uncharacterized protein
MKRFFLFSGFFFALYLILFVSGCSDDDPSGQTYVGWAVGGPMTGGGTIIRTVNGGQTWVQQGASQIPAVFYNDVSAVDSQNVWVVGESSAGDDGSSYGTILRTRNSGATWLRQGSPQSIPDTGLSGVSAVDGDMAWVVGGQGTVLKTIDGGDTWVQQAQDMLPNAAFQMVYALDRENVWAVGSDNATTAVIIHTTDGGDTWVRQGEKDIPPDPDTYYAFIDVHAVDTKNAWAVGARSTVFVTTDGGQNWTNKTPGCVHFLDNNGVCLLTALSGWVVSDSNNICFTTDGGDTWIKQAAPSAVDIPTLSSALLGVTAIDANRAWIVGMNPIGDEHAIVFQTGDGGTVWQKQVSPANAGFRRVSFAGARR